MRNSLLVVNLCRRLHDRAFWRLPRRIVNRLARLLGNRNQVIQPSWQQIQLCFGCLDNVLRVVESFFDGLTATQSTVVRQQQDLRVGTQAAG